MLDAKDRRARRETGEGVWQRGSITRYRDAELQLLLAFFTEGYDLQVSQAVRIRGGRATAAEQTQE